MAPVVIVSIDGFSAALAADPTLRLPALRGLAARGVAAAGLRPAFPSVTWPCHTTLVTGTAPARHGILGNEVLDRASGHGLFHEGDVCDTPPRVPTLWDATAAAGRSSAALCWPKTRGVTALTDNVPEFLDQELFEAWARATACRRHRPRGTGRGHWPGRAPRCPGSRGGRARSR